ncbi:hypothetical protein F4809DRAFT_399810 [Biscogniauxia mediterranea]|nr:hypothetical protein F4809DRAFT_399810 [Biscogniauxia mediterranea]
MSRTDGCCFCCCCCCGSETSKAKAWARRILGLAHHNHTTTSDKTAPSAKRASGRCPKCGLAMNREAVLLGVHPLRQHVPYQEKHVVSDTAHLAFRLSLNSYISCRGHRRCCRELAFEIENAVAERVYAQLVLGDSPIIGDVMGKYGDNFRRLPPHVLEELHDVIDFQVEQVLKLNMI